METSRNHTSNYQSLSHKHWISILQVPPAISVRAQCKVKVCINLHMFFFPVSSICGLQLVVVFMQIGFVIYLKCVFVTESGNALGTLEFVSIGILSPVCMLCGCVVIGPSICLSACWFVLFNRPGIWKDLKTMGSVSLSIFFITLLVLGRQVRRSSVVSWGADLHCSRVSVKKKKSFRSSNYLDKHRHPRCGPDTKKKVVCPWGANFRTPEIGINSFCKQLKLQTLVWVGHSEQHTSSPN